MTVDISLIPQERVQDLISTLDNIQNSLSNNLVHKSGNETISGLKTFSSALKRSSTINQSTTSGEVEVGSITVYDKDGSPVGLYNTTRSTTTNTNRQRVTNKNVTGASWFDFRVNVNDAGKGWVNTSQGAGITSNGSLSDVSSSTTDTVIPTKGWVNNPNTSTNVVHRNGNETITGIKTFSGTNVFNTSYTNYKSTTMDIVNSPTTYDTVGLQFVDKLGYVGGQDVLRSESDGRIMNWCYVHNHANTAWTGNGVGFDSNDNAVAYITGKLVKGFVTSTYISGTNWYRVWSDGWIEQGGIVNSTQYNNTSMNVTFLKPMSNTSYYACANPNTNDHQGTWNVNARCAVKTTTGMSVHGANNNSSAYTGPCSWYACGY